MNLDDVDIAFIFASGRGKVGWQSLYLLRSLRRHHPNAPVYVYVPAEELDEMDPDIEDELEDKASLLHGEIPIPEYPISTKIAALEAAETEADADYLLMLDTDVLVLNEINVHRSDIGPANTVGREKITAGEGADLYLKPVDVGRQFWGRERSRGQWERLYDRYGQAMPEYRVRSTFDGIEMLPYWNAGFVLTGVDGFGTAWRELTEDLHGEIPYDRHADQVALGLLSTRYETGVLDNRYNYPIHLRLRCRSDLKVLHYHNASNLARVRNRAIQEQIRAIGMDEAIDIPRTERLKLLGDAVQNYLRRRTLPIDETHALERAYLKVRSLVP